MLNFDIMKQTSQMYRSCIQSMYCENVSSVGTFGSDRFENLNIHFDAIITFGLTSQSYHTE